MDWLNPYREKLSPYIFAEWEDGVLLCGDCMDICPAIPAKSINLIVNDPPYNINGGLVGWSDKPRKCEWDKIENYPEWTASWMKEAERLMMDNASFYMFHAVFPTICEIFQWIGKYTALVFKQFVVWNKRFDGCWNKNFLNIGIENDNVRNYYRKAEYILFYTFQDETGLSRIYNDRDCFGSIKEYLRTERKKAGITYPEVNKILGTAEGSGQPGHYFSDSQWCLPTAEMYAKLQTTGYFQRPYEQLRQEYEQLRQEYEQLRYTFNNQKTHHSVWNYETVKNPVHPTQKPVDLIENIILHSSNPGDVILDMFAGSGTTGVACIRNGRQFVLCEKEVGYCETGKHRIDAEYARLAEEARQLVMFEVKV